MNIPYLNTAPAILFLAFVATVLVLEMLLLARWLWGKAHRRPRPLRPHHLVVHGLTAAGGVCVLYAAFVEPYRPEVVTVRLETDKLENTVLRIVQISDLHCDPKPRLEPRLPDLVNGLKPDVIVFTGDAVNSPGALALFQRTLAAMEAPLGKFAVRGNWDYRFGLNLFEGTGFEELPLTALRLEKDGQPWMICGVSFFSIRAAHRAVNQLDSETWNLFLFHSPDLIDRLADWPVDLYLCGHTHGGQIALPFYGALTTMSNHGRDFQAGLYTVGETAVYVNRGIGMSGSVPRLRFLARPEITLFEIHPARTTAPQRPDED